MSSSSPHIWKFLRTGGLDQVSLETAADLRALGQLDQKLWVALSCPVKGTELDERTLALIDTDGDGHVRPPEVIAAVNWACDRLREPAALLAGGPALPVAAIAETAEGAPLRAAAAWVLGKAAKQEAVDPKDASDALKDLTKGALKGDGELRPEAAPDEPTRALITDIANCCGKVNEPNVASFYADLEGFRAWSHSGGAAAAGLGPMAEEAFAAVDAVKKKVVDYFFRTRLAAFDAAAAFGINRQPDDYHALTATDLSPDSPALLALPLAHISPNRPLPLRQGVNPAWAAALERLRNSAVVPILGRETDELTEAEWGQVAAKLSPFASWVGTRPVSPVASLGIARIEAILEGAGRAALAKLFAEDRQLAPRADIERLAHYYRDLGTLLRNFVNFLDFYSKSKPAIFQAGTLYLDSRSCHLCIQVDDPAAHSAYGAMSRTYVAYLECRRPKLPVLKLAAAFTQGDSDYLFVGRNGVFYDHDGQDWDATVVKVCEAPISIRQAFFSPYKKVASFVGDSLSKYASAKEQAVQSSLTTAAVAAPAAGTGANAPFDIAKFAGIFAAIGLAVGAIGGAITGVWGRLENGPFYEAPLAAAAALLIISGPSMVLAALKLRERNLGPLLEGTGWAVNGRVKINIPLGLVLTDRRTLPPHATHDTLDPYEGETRRNLAVALGLLLLLTLGFAWVEHTWPFGPWSIGTPAIPATSTARPAPPARPH